MTAVWRMMLCSVLVASIVTIPAAAQSTYTMFPAVPREPSEQPGQHARAPLVTLTVHDSTLKYILNELTRQAHVQLLCNTKNPVFERRMTVHVTRANVIDALTTVLKGTGYTAKMAPDGETVVVARAHAAHPPVQGASGIVAGRVIDSASGGGLRGATVKVQGLKLSALTSDSGQLTLYDVPSGAQLLTVRLFGYKPAEHTVTVVDSQVTTIRIVMVPIPTILSGVVTTAAGKEERYKVGNDITVLNADSILKVAPVSNLTDMLETRVPGLIVQRTSGIPGAPSRLRLRGLSSVNSSSDPVVIVDGVRVYADQSGTTNPLTHTVVGGGSNITGSTVNGQSMQFAGPSPLDQIDPNSIETIEVLKGPSATAIYGSDAAAGVIVITTKHGRVGPTHWNLVLDQGRTTLPGAWPTNYFDFCRTAFNDEHSEICNKTYEVGQQVFAVYEDSLVPFQALNNAATSPLAGAPGQNRDASLTVSGGSGTLTYSATGSASDQRGYLHLPLIELQRFQTFHGFPAPSWMRTPDQYTTYGANSQLTVQLGKTGGLLSLTSSLFHSAQQQSSLQADLAALDTMYIDRSQLAEQPLFSNYYTQALLHTTTFTNALSVNNLAFWSWLPLTATLGLNVGDLSNSTLTPRDYITCLGNVADQTCNTDSLGSYAVTQGTNATTSLTVGTTLRHGLVSTALGINVYTQSQSGFSAQTVGLPIGVSVPSQFQYSDSGGPSYSTANAATYGWYVQPTFNFGNRFFASPGFRLDGGSNVGSSRGATGAGGSGGGLLSLFPKLDFSWIAVNRSPSHPMFGALTLLRPRIAVGIAGVQPGSAEQLRLLTPLEITPVPGLDGTSISQSILQLSTLGNPQLHPERDHEVEGGVDAQFWNQRLSLTLTGYRKLAIDAILAIPVAPSVGAYGEGGNFSGYTSNVNIGNIRNTGVEATVFARILDGRAFDWSVNANVTLNRNRLVSLAPGQPTVVEGGIDSPIQTRITPGYPVDGLWANPIVGFSDVNRDGIIEPSEIVVGDSARYVGAQQPSYETTVSTVLGFFNNRVSITTSVDYQSGLTQNLTNTNFGLLLNTPGVTPAQQAAVFASGATPASGIGQLQAANALRWNSLSVNVLMPQRVARWFRVPNLSVALQGSNLGLYTKYRGKDPNVNVYSSGNFTADDGNALPQPRVWSLRVNLSN